MKRARSELNHVHSRRANSCRGAHLGLGALRLNWTKRRGVIIREIGRFADAATSSKLTQIKCLGDFYISKRAANQLNLYAPGALLSFHFYSFSVASTLSLVDKNRCSMIYASSMVPSFWHNINHPSRYRIQKKNTQACLSGPKGPRKN